MRYINRLFTYLLTYLHVGSPKISVHMIGTGGWLHVKSSWVHAQVTKNCFVDIWLLGTKRRFITGTYLANYNSCSGRKWIAPHLQKSVDCNQKSVISTTNCSEYDNSFLGYRQIAYNRLPASWKDSYWSVLCKTNVQVT